MPLAKRRVVCVDDDQDTGTLLTSLLRREDCEVVMVNTLAEALEMSRDKPFDLYVLDVWFAEGGGVGLCRRVREAAPEAPLVVYSSASRMDDRQGALVAGASAFVKKPDARKLAEVVKALLHFSTDQGRGGEANGQR
jgi:DNA-binding response OmpR family regulator